MKLKAAFCEAIRRWDKKHRLVGQTSVEKLYDESIEALEGLAKSSKESCLVDIGAGNGLLGFPWLEMKREHKAIFIEPDFKKAAFLIDFVSHGSVPELSLKERTLILPSRFEDVPRETIEAFAGEDYILTTRAFSGARSLEEVFDLSHLKNKEIFVFGLVNTKPCFKRLR